MPFWEVSIDCSAIEIEDICDRLSKVGSIAISMLDAKDEPLLEPDPGTTPLWQHAKVVGLFEGNQTLKGLKDKIAAFFQEKDVVINELEDQDWVKNCQKDFPAKAYHQNFWVCPSWDHVNDDNAIVLKLDPGLAFGTGSHPTTSLCLDFISQLPLENKVLVDYGCGSGILGLAGLMLGAKEVYAIDHDSQALLSTQQNARDNHVHLSQLVICKPDVFAQMNQQCDILVANILAGPLIELAPVFKDCLFSGGQLILAGILATQADDVRDAYQQDFEFDGPVFEEDWVRLTAIKK